MASGWERVENGERSLNSEQKLGVRREGSGALTSHLLELIGKDRFVAAPAVPVEGRWLLVDREIAHRLGLQANPQQSTAADLAHMTQKLAFRMARPNEVGTQVLFPTRYGGSGTEGGGGDGRTALLGEYNVAVKGVGKTPLTTASKKFHHSHGGAGIREGLIEYVFGRVNENLFTHGSTRVLGLFGTEEAIEWPDGGREPAALIMRTGRQLRPAHLLDNTPAANNMVTLHAAPGAVDMFIRATKDSGDLVLRKGRPNLAATMTKIIERHAQTMAEQYRWRVLHGSPTTSNMELDGGELDLCTETCQPRTAPIFASGRGHFGVEHEQRAHELNATYSALAQSLEPSERARLGAFPLDVDTVMREAYVKALTRELVSAAGLSHALSDKVLQAQAKPGFAATVYRLSQIHNAVPKAELNADQQISENGAVVDVFNLLRYFPADFFRSPRQSRDRLIEKAMDLLRPLPLGSEAECAEKVKQARALAEDFVDQYAKLMDNAERLSGLDARTFAHATEQRAVFENAPIDQLYHAGLNRKLIEMVDDFNATKDARRLERKAEQVIAKSLRNVDQLLAQGDSVTGKDGSVLVQHRFLGGIEYGLQRSAEGQFTMRAQLSAEAVGDDHFRFSSLPGEPVLSREQITALQYHVTTDDWRANADQPAVVRNEGKRLSVSFEVPVAAGDVGRVEGSFHVPGSDVWLKDGDENFVGYAFAVPVEP